MFGRGCEVDATCLLQHMTVRFVDASCKIIADLRHSGRTSHIRGVVCSWRTLHSPLRLLGVHAQDGGKQFTVVADRVLSKRVLGQSCWDDTPGAVS